ncbi:MAG TPA: glycoside hydrolase family 15 protein [Candidatus Binataceae bacterium]|nr:glycoside hydrolase family 15 protein [Candidatus Binataceae bacterium]
MATLEYQPKANGGPGIEPRWARSAKDIVGTAYATSSRIWYTASAGIINEIYFPTIDLPQVRDLQFLITDGESFFHDERRNLDSTTEYLGDYGLGARIVSHDRQGRYRIVKEIIADPHQPCLLVDARLEGEDEAFLAKLHLYVLLAPHLGVGGWGNNGNAGLIVGHEFLTANKNGTWLALGASVPFIARSCGYVGTTDGWQDLNANYRLDHQFAAADDGNIALTGELDLRKTRSFTMGLSFGRSLHRATTTLFQALGTPFRENRARFLDQWIRAARHLYPLEKFSGDKGSLYRRSRELLFAHEDKTYPGAMIASLSIPWGESKGDEQLGGYHLVWTRDLVNSVTGLMAAGDDSTAMRALIYLACSQQLDGGFPQNFWIDGTAYWTGVQLDEIAFPIMLAWRLHEADALGAYDPAPMVKAAARYLLLKGPVTPQDRWEENSGYSPSTLAANIAALICAAEMARDRGNLPAAIYLEEYADFLECHLEEWTVTNQGSIVPEIKRHYVRINPIDPSQLQPDENPDHGVVLVKNQPPGTQAEFPAAQVVDGGFLELVRYGIRRADDPLIEATVRVVDASLRHDFPQGPCFLRYSHDGYGQQDDGGPFTSYGRGRPWPLLTGERGHYELAAGRDARPYLSAMEAFATATGLLPEQIWDKQDIPSELLSYGRQTGAAMPLMWAHAEYIKLLRSVADGRVFDFIPAVAARYIEGAKRRRIEIWKHNRQPKAVRAGSLLRFQTTDPFILHWSRDGWANVNDTSATMTPLGVAHADIDLASNETGQIVFTFRWRDPEHWEGRNYTIEIERD